MLASLLPGLRDLRAPLAAGYLWLAAGWLYFAPQLPASVNEADGVLKDIYRLVAADGPVVVAAVITFAAYLLGILSTGLLTPIFRRIVQFLMAVPIIGMMFFALRTPLLDFVGTETSDPDEEILDLFVKRFGKFYSPSTVRARNLVVDKLVKRVLRDRDFRELVFQRIEMISWQTSERWIQKLDDRWWLDSDECAQLEDPLRGHQEKVIAARDIICKYLEKSEGIAHDAAHLLVKWAIDVDHHASEIYEELAFVPERIVDSRHATYERWDRLNAEGEFREAIVPPLLAIVGVLLIRGVLDWPFGLIFAAPALVILIQGIIKGNVAEAQLMQTIEANVIQVAPVERLSTDDLQWNR